MVLKGLDPMLPFTLAGITLAMATLGFTAYEARMRQPAMQRAMQPTAQTTPPFNAIARPAFVILLLGAGFQVHFFINAAPLYKSVADPTLLPWLMPLFWIGFSIAVYPGARLIKRHAAASVFALSALLGSAASAACLASPPLPLLMTLQALAGIAWGGVFLSGLCLAGALGHTGREALFIGVLFACLAVGAVTRIGLSLAGVSFSVNLTVPLAAGLWAVGAMLSLPWLRARTAIGRVM